MGGIEGNPNGLSPLGQNGASAQVQLDLALQHRAGEPDSSCELALLLCFQGKEDRAFELVPVSENGRRFSDLLSILANHYSCRLKLEPLDEDARQRSRLLKTFKPQISAVGVKLSACLIVKDEEATLRRCLDSLAGVVDEVVVVDTGSSDETAHIARECGATVAEFRWCDDFSAARNFALALATGDWILWIDADEELRGGSSEAIRRAIVRPHFGGFDIEIVNFLGAENDSEEFRHCPTRLFRHLPEITFSGRIHEQINPSLARLGLPWARLEGAQILHHGYRTEVMEEKGKLARTINLLEKEVQEDPQNSFQLFNLANAYIVACRYEEAARAARASIDCFPTNCGYGVQAYVLLTQALMGSGELQNAVRAADEACEKGLYCLPIAFERCTALLKDGQLETAKKEAERMMALEWEAGLAGDRAIETYKRHLVFGQVLNGLGEHEAALDQVKLALAHVPNYAPALLIAGEVYESLGVLSEAENYYSFATRDPKYLKEALVRLARVMAATGKAAEAAKLLKSQWMANPADVEVWLRWKNACEEAGNEGGVLECFRNFAELHHVTAEFLIDWGRAACGVGQNQLALRCFAEAMRISPEQPNSYFNCGDLLYRMGSFNEAAQMYQAGLALAKDFPEGWFTLGNALARANRRDEALAAYAIVLSQKPDHTGARHNLETMAAA